MAGYEYCYGHRPDLADARRRNASQGGKSGGRGRPRSETDALKKEIRDVIGGVLDGRIPQGQAAVAVQGYNSLLRVLEQERRQGTPGSGVMTHEAFSRQMEQVIEVVMRHVPRDKLAALDAEIGAILDEAASG